MSELFKQVMYYIGIEKALITLGYKVSWSGSINPPLPRSQKYAVNIIIIVVTQRRNRMKVCS